MHVELNDEEYKVLRECFRDKQKIAELAGLALLALGDEVARKEATGWDSVAKLCGFKDHNDSLSQKKVCRIDWLLKRIEVDDIVPPEVSEADN